MVFGLPFASGVWGEVAVAEYAGVVDASVLRIVLG